VFVEVFENYIDTGSSIALSTPVGSFSSESVDFFVGTGGSWHPFGLSSFGARITGNLYFESGANLRLGMGSSDGSYLFLNGNLEVNHGGVHGYSIASSNPLNFEPIVGHPFEIQFYKSPGGGISAVELGSFFQTGGFYHFSPSVYDPVPEPATFLVLLPALALCRKKRS
jgi:hypothetical protein